MGPGFESLRVDQACFYRLFFIPKIKTGRVHGDEMENFLENAREKILLLDILDKSKDKLTEETLSTFVLNLELMNYFDFRSHLGFLQESNLVHSYGDVRITEEGRRTLEVLREEVDEKLLKDVEERLEEYLKVVKEPLKIEYLGDFARIWGSEFQITIEGQLEKEKFMNSYEKIYNYIKKEMKGE